jgi:hypothetical protein
VDGIEDWKNGMMEQWGGSASDLSNIPIFHILQYSIIPN